MLQSDTSSKKELENSIPNNLLEAAKFTSKEITKFRLVQLHSLGSLFITFLALFLPLMHFQWFEGSIIDYLSISLFFQSVVISPTIGFPMGFIFILCIPLIFILGFIFHVTYHKKYLVAQLLAQAFLTFSTFFFLMILQVALENKTRILFDVGVTQVSPVLFISSVIGEAPWLLSSSTVLAFIGVLLYDIRMKDKIEGYYQQLMVIFHFSGRMKSGEYI